MKRTSRQSKYRSARVGLGMAACAIAILSSGCGTSDGASWSDGMLGTPVVSSSDEAGPLSVNASLRDDVQVADPEASKPEVTFELSVSVTNQGDTAVSVYPRVAQRTQPLWTVWLSTRHTVDVAPGSTVSMDVDVTKAIDRARFDGNPDTLHVGFCEAGDTFCGPNEVLGSDTLEVTLPTEPGS